MDQIIDETLRLEKREGMYFFLMPYAKEGPYAMQPPHSPFLDSEIALMLASRRVVDEKKEYNLVPTSLHCFNRCRVFFYQFTAQGKMSYKFYVQNERSTNGVTRLSFDKWPRLGQEVGGSSCDSKGELVISLPQGIMPTSIRM